MNGASENALRRLLTSAEFGEGVVDALLEAGRKREVPAGETLFRAGDAVRSLAIVEAGTVTLLCGLDNGSEHVVASLSAGEVVGWEALTHERAAAFAARTSQLTRLFVIPVAALRDLFEVSPGATALLADAALRTMNRVRKTEGPPRLVRESPLDSGGG